MTLLDAWLVAPGEARPADAEQRLTDAQIIPSGLTSLRLYVNVPGVFDAHLRLTDAITGATSEIVVVPIETGSQTSSCAQASPSSTSFAAVLLAVFAFSAFARRRRRGL